MSRKSRRRKKSASITLPGGASVPQPRSGRDRTQPPAEDARLTALTARARHANCSPAEAKDPMRADPVGLCIIALQPAPDRQSDLWSMWCRIDAARAAYYRHVIGSNPNPQNAAIAMVPEPMDIDPTRRPDLRSPAEKAEASKRAWLALEPHLGGTLRNHLDGYAAPLWRNGAPTLTGGLVVRDLMALDKQLSK